MFVDFYVRMYTNSSLIACILGGGHRTLLHSEPNETTEIVTIDEFPQSEAFAI